MKCKSVAYFFSDDSGYLNESIHTWLHVHRDYYPYPFPSTYSYPIKQIHPYPTTPTHPYPTPPTYPYPIPPMHPYPIPPTYPYQYSPTHADPLPLTYPYPITHTHTPYTTHLPPILNMVGVGRGSKIWCKANISPELNYRHLVHSRQLSRWTSIM